LPVNTSAEFLSHIIAAIKTPDTRTSPRDVTGKCAVNNCDEARTEWNYNAIGGDNFFAQI
jgi:hypothetical protein